VLLAFAGMACGSGNGDDTEVLGIQIDRESPSVSDEPTQQPTDPATEPSPSVIATTPSPTTAPTAAPTPASPSPTPPPEPTEPVYPAELAEPGSSSGALQEWVIGDDGVAAPRTQLIAPERIERNSDGTDNREPDWYDVIDVTPLDGQSIEAVCSAVATADGHRDLAVTGTLTIDLLVDDVVVATTSGAVDTVIGAATTASLLSMDPYGPISVGTQPGEDVKITCQVGLT
jgi:hypothetical protein